ncbi:surface carbohydrate biosynthesis protein [Halobacillus sp. B23F22_1]|uniref:surface carbohydrate biosynthesis protein n=1 Tax=Halobacillus sp. B23F22_1 TaxID=3459514 RepID=UPI00373E3815
MSTVRPPRKVMYVPIEIKARELNAKLLFSYYAALENYRVIIGEQRIVEQASNVMPPGIFFSKGYSQRYRRRVLTNAKKAGHAIVELDEEGFIFHDPAIYLTERMNEAMLPLVEQIYCWGPHQREVIVNAYPACDARCFIVGNSRFDLLKKKYRPLFKEKASLLKKQYGDFILVNTRFALYNHFRGKKQPDKDSGVEYIKKLYDAFLDMVKTLSKRNLSLNIVVRPHPSENAQSYRKEFSSFTNVYVRCDGQASDWIAASRVVIHNGCTTAIEASLLDTPVISYLPFQDDRYDVALPNKAGVVLTSLDEVLYCMDHKVKRSRTRFLTPFYHKDLWAHEIILSHVNQLKLKEAPYKQINIPNVRSKHIKHRFPSLKAQEIRDFMTKLHHIEGGGDRVTIRPLAQNLFELSLDKGEKG